MTDPIIQAARALRETYQGESASSAFTRTRVLAAVRKQRQRRTLRWALGIPLAATLFGSVAWAGTTGRLAVLATHLVDTLGWRTAPSESVPSSDRSKPKARTRSRQGTGTTPAPAPSNSAPPVSTEQPPAPELDAAPAKAPASASPPAEAPARSTAPVDDARTLRDLSLYGEAHDAHFVDRDPERALLAWNRYLREMPRGRFATEARYNRALTLVRLGRYQDAKQALLPFADGAFGTYHQKDARALLDSLEQKAP